jgi:DNA polymerase V
MAALFHEVMKTGCRNGPYFMAKPLIRKHGALIFFNYNLYGDLSWRVMETLRMMLGKKM